MNALLITLLIIVLAGGIAGALVLGRILRQLRLLDSPPNESALVVMQAQLDAMREQLRESLAGGRLELDRRLEETNKIVGDVRRSLGAVDRQVRTVADATRELSSLQELMRSPKARGGMGEFLLAELLSQVLPQAHYSFQHEFSGGERVDAVLRLGNGLVPVDAKFPLENFLKLRRAAEREDEREERGALRTFRADVRRHVDAIAKRYIRPDEGTYEFALMYIPAEAVYQEIIRQEAEDGLDLFHYALLKKVVPVSPQSFYAYLQVIVLGLRGLNIEHRAEEIMRRLGGIRTKLTGFTESFDIVGRHLGHAQRQMDEAGRRLERLDAAVGALADEGAAPEIGAAPRTGEMGESRVRDSQPPGH